MQKEGLTRKRREVNQNEARDPGAEWGRETLRTKYRGTCMGRSHDEAHYSVCCPKTFIINKRRSRLGRSLSE